MHARSFVLIFNLIFFRNLSSQNLVINSGFDTPIIWSIKNFDDQCFQFHCKHWTVPTESSVDLFCDSLNSELIKNNLYWILNKNYSSKLPSNNYFIGLYPFKFDGYMEHITGKLKDTLVGNKLYKISFNISNIGGPFIKYTGLIPLNYGFKFTNTAQLFKQNKEYKKRNYLKIKTDFKSNETYKLSKGKNKIVINPKEKEEGQGSAFYCDLYDSNDVYADGLFDLKHVDKSWETIEYYYKANGGERFITLGTFKFKNHEEIVKIINLMKKGDVKSRTKFVRKHLNLISKMVFPQNGMFSENNIKAMGESLLTTYFLIDNVCVEEVKN